MPIRTVYNLRINLKKLKPERDALKLITEHPFGLVKNTAPLIVRRVVDFINDF